jgi:hypothetical protein
MGGVLEPLLIAGDGAGESNDGLVAIHQPVLGKCLHVLFKEGQGDARVFD